MHRFALSRWFIGIFLFLILLAHFLLTITSAYFYFWWMDILMHIAGGFWVAILAIYLSKDLKVSDLIFLWLVLGLAAIIGVLWEFMEFGVNQFWKNLGHNAFMQPDLPDTLGDLLSDFIGGLAAFSLFKKRQKNL